MRYICIEPDMSKFWLDKSIIGEVYCLTQRWGMFKPRRMIFRWAATARGDNNARSRAALHSNRLGKKIWLWPSNEKLRFVHFECGNITWGKTGDIYWQHDKIWLGQRQSNQLYPKGWPICIYRWLTPSSSLLWSLLKNPDLSSYLFEGQNWGQESVDRRTNSR